MSKNKMKINQQINLIKYHMIMNINKMKKFQNIKNIHINKIHINKIHIKRKHIKKITNIKIKPLIIIKIH